MPERRIHASPTLVSMLASGLAQLKASGTQVNDESGTVYSDPKLLINSYVKQAEMRWQENQKPNALLAIFRTHIAGGMEIGVLLLAPDYEFFVGLRKEIEKLHPIAQRGEVVLPSSISDGEWESYLRRN